MKRNDHCLHMAGVIGLLILWSVSISSAAVTNGMTAYYPFSGNANDASGNARHGTVNGATLTADRNGQANNAYAFDGTNDWISASGGSLINISKGTFAAYIYVDTFVPISAIISKGTSALTDFIVGVSDSTLRKVAVNMGSSLYVSSTAEIPLGTWTHIAVTWDGSAWKLYINGVLDTEVATTDVPLNNSNALKIGSHYHTSGTKYFAGKIDDVRIYNRALSVSEVALLSAPSAPGSVSASDGTYTDKVRVSWDSATNASGYSVWRGTASDSGSAISIGTTTATTYDDTGAVAGMTYYYWVKATNTAGASAFSASDSGYRAAASGAPSAPTNVVASDGAYTDRVRVSWDTVSGTTSYEVWRNTSNDWASAGKVSDALAFTVSDLAQGMAGLQVSGGEAEAALGAIDAAAGATYDDTTAVAGTVYYYWVKARNSSGTSGFSTADSGYLYVAVPGSLVPPANVVASDGTYTNKVRIMWNAVAGATAYEVWRGNINVSAFATKLGEVAGTLADNTDAIAETVYYYWVKARNATDTSAFSSSDSGYRSNVGSIQPDVKINEADGTITMHRGADLRVAILLMTSSGINADWWFVAATPGGWYYYDASAGTWLTFTDLATLHPSYQGPLFDFLAPVEMLRINTIWLVPGVYVIYFGVDTTMNGILDDTLYYDSSTLNLVE